jgi:hypothetical protein
MCESSGLSPREGGGPTRREGKAIPGWRSASARPCAVVAGILSGLVCEPRQDLEGSRQSPIEVRNVFASSTGVLKRSWGRG